MAELADAEDSKSSDRKVLWVRPPLWACRWGPCVRRVTEGDQRLRVVVRYSGKPMRVRLVDCIGF